MLTAEIRNSRTVRALNLIFEHSSSNMDYIHVGAIWVTLAKMESGKDPTGKEILLMKLQALTEQHLSSMEVRELINVVNAMATLGFDRDTTLDEKLVEDESGSRHHAAVRDSEASGGDRA
jgi:hypothetical protein